MPIIILINYYYFGCYGSNSYNLSDARAWCLEDFLLIMALHAGMKSVDLKRLTIAEGVILEQHVT